MGSGPPPLIELLPLLWDFGDLADKLEIKGSGGAKYVVFPALTREGDDIALRIYKEKNMALSSHKAGVTALFEKHFSKEMKSLKKDLSLKGKAKDLSNYFGGPKPFEDNLYKSVTTELFSKNIRNHSDFLTHADAACRWFKPTKSQT